jgi:purine-binding chemotaxis protein CheW
MDLAIEHTPSTKPMPGKPALGGRFLTFYLSSEEYGFEILKVQEIIGFQVITPVPNTPECVRGVINLRGKVVPVLDLRAKFGMSPVEPTAETCIIVVRLDLLEMGILVDRVSEVLEIAPENIDPVPYFGVGINTNFILGLGKSQGKVRILLAIDKVLSMDEVAEVCASAGEAA